MVSDESLNIQKCETWENLEALRADWEALLDRYPYATAFSTLEWLGSWWRALGANEQLVVLAFRSGSALVALAPLELSRQDALGMKLRSLRLLGDGSHDSENLDFPVRSGDEQRFCSAFMDWLEGNAGEWDICQFYTLPSDSPIGGRLLDQVKRRGWTVLSSTRPRCVIVLPEGWELYLKSLSSKERGKIGLRTRKLEKNYEVKAYRCAEQSMLDPLLDALFVLHSKHWQRRGAPGTLNSPARRQFYRELARLMLARGRLEFWAMELDGAIVAAQFGFRHRDTVFSLQEGFDPDYSTDSVGYVLRSQVLKQLIAEGVRCYDFLGGVDESKIRWGAQVKQYINLEFARPWTRGGLYLSLKSKSAETKAWVRENLPRRLLTALRTARGRQRV
jgi:CelD/BcsL family acetyltransferase involved in cellulose biosynthesis